MPKATTKPAPTPVPAPATATGIKKVNFGAIASTTAKKPAGKEYPLLPEDEEGRVAELVTEILSEQEQLDALEG